MARRGARPVHEAPFSVYEVHLPSWRPGLTYRQLAEQLPAYVKDLGFTHVEFMPVSEHPFGGSWGYQVTGFYAPTSRWAPPTTSGTWSTRCTEAGIGVIVDWVPAHFPKDDWALARVRRAHRCTSTRTRTRAEHPDWGTLEFDYGRKEVRNFLVANAVYWCEEFHVDGLRVDAVASMLYLDYSREDGEWSPNEHGGRENLDAVAFLQEMNATVYRRCPGVVTIAEESTAWDGVTRAPTDRRRSRLRPEVEHGLDARFARLRPARAGAPQVPPQRDDLLDGVRVQRELRAADLARRGGPRQAGAGVEDAGRLVAAARHPPRLPGVHVGPPRQATPFHGAGVRAGRGVVRGARPRLVAAGPVLRRRARPPRRTGSGARPEPGVRGPPALWERDTDPAGFSWIDGRRGGGQRLRLPAPRRGGLAAAGGLQLLSRGPGGVPPGCAGRRSPPGRSCSTPTTRATAGAASATRGR